MRRTHQSFPIPSALFMASLRTTVGSTRARRSLVLSHPCRRDDLLRHPNTPHAPPVPSAPPPACAARAASPRHRSPHTTHPQRSVSAGGAAARRSSARNRRARAVGKYPTAGVHVGDSSNAINADFSTLSSSTYLPYFIYFQYCSWLSTSELEFSRSADTHREPPSHWWDWRFHGVFMSRHCGCDFRTVQISAPGPWCVSSAIELLLLAPALARRHSRAVLPVLSSSKKGRRNKAEENLDACVCRAETPSEIPSQGLAFFVTDLM
jgi:hypothetical protein